MEKSELKERPIIMSAESVRAILEGHKTQTSRVIKPRYKQDEYGFNVVSRPATGERWVEKTDEDGGDFEDGTRIVPCPYGNIGERLWLKETWGVGCRPDPYSGWVDGIEYKADEAYLDDIESLPLRVIDDQDLDKYQRAGWNSPMFMPRWASRITLEITDIRVERVQDITPEDAIAEGMPIPYVSRDEYEPISMYRELWQKLNAKRGYSWESNPWVWVVSFRVVGGKE